MFVSRQISVVILAALFCLGAALVLAGNIAPAQAQCPAGADCQPEINPTPPRTDCPPGSHPVGLKDCELDGTANQIVFQTPPPQGGPSILADLNFTGVPVSVNGSLPHTGTFDRLTESASQTCGGDSVNNGINYRAYIIMNTSNQAQTVDIELSKNSGVLAPFVFLYDSNFTAASPTVNCLKADEGSGGTAKITRFTWQANRQLVVVATGLDSGSDEGSYTLKITPVGSEYEPNDDAASARPISPNIDWITAEISPTGDIDYYRFEAVAGQRVWAYIRTGQSTNSTDSLLQLRNGSDVLQISDDNDGGQGSNSSAIAGFDIPSSGTYLVRVTEQGDNDTITPYYLYLYLADQTTVPEVETNDTVSNATGYDEDGGSSYQLAPQLFSGLQGGSNSDFFKLTVPPSSVIFTSLDTDSDDNSTEFDGTLKLHNAGGSQVAAVDSSDSSPRAEALSYGQVSSELVDNNTWYLSVISNSTGINYEYHLLAGYSPTGQGDVIYSTDVTGKLIPDGGTVTSTLISGFSCMENLDIWLDLDHDNLDDLDITLEGPDSTTVALFTDRGGDDNSLSLTLDDEGGLATLPDSGVDTADAKIGGRYQTESKTLSTFYDEIGIGQWTLTITDDTGGNDDAGTVDKLNNWALIMHCTSK